MKKILIAVAFAFVSQIGFAQQDEAFKKDVMKVIIYNKHDFVFAEEQAAKVNANAILFLQPEWSKKEEMTPLIVDYVMKNPKWRVSLQTHKYLNIP